MCPILLGKGKEHGYRCREEHGYLGRALTQYVQMCLAA